MQKKHGSFTEEREGEGPVTKVNLGRLTNCIFAFSLLFLFKNIQIPSILEVDSPDYLPKYLEMITPEAFNFVNAFLVIAIIWILTFHILHRIRRLNHGFLFLHFGMLMTLVFIPVSSLLADDFPKEPIFSLILHLNILLISSFLLMEWKSVCYHETLLHHYIGEIEIRKTYIRLFFLIGASLIGVILTLYDWEQTRFIYILVLLILFFESVLSDRERWRRKHELREIGTLEKEGLPEDRPVIPAGHLLPDDHTTGTNDYQGPVGMDMLEILMNGVFAFTMTLIVKNITLPRVSDGQNIDLIVDFFFKIFFDTIEFVLVFIILAFFWVLTFQLLRWMRAVDLTFVYLELFLLLHIVFIPVTSSLFTFFGDETHISILYSLNILFCGLILIIQWYYVSRRTDLLNEEAAFRIKCAPIHLFLRGYIQIRTNEGRDQSILRIRNHLFILPIVSIIWLVFSLIDMGYLLVPVLIGVCYLVFKLWD